MQSRRLLSPIGWVFVLAFAVRLLVFLRFAESIHFAPESGDMRFYAEWGERFARGAGLDGRAFYGLPGYPVLLGAVFALFGFSPFLVGFLQLFAEAGTATLLFRMGEWALPGRRGVWAGGMAAAGWTVYQPAQAFSLVLMPTTWLVFAFWGIVAWSFRTAHPPEASGSGSPERRHSLVWPWLVMGWVIGVGATLVATLLALLPLPVAAAWLRFRGSRWRAVPVAAAMLLLGVAAGTGPCWAYNRFVAGEPVFLSAHSGVNFWIGNHPEANGYPKIPPGLRASQSGMLADSITQAEGAVGRPLSRAEVSRYWSEKAKAYIASHPGEWLRLMGMKVRNFWNAFSYDDLSLIAPLREEGVLTPGLRWGLVAVLAFPGALLTVRRCRVARWTAGAVLLHLAVLLPVFVNERYRLAAAPGLLLLGALGLVRLADTLRLRAPESGRVALLWLGAGAAGSLLVWWPLGLPALTALEAFNTGVRALEQGRLEIAEEKLTAAHAQTPHNAEVCFALGNLHLARKHREQSKRFYAATLALEPTHPGALNNLSLLALEERQWNAARALALRAVAQEPENAKSFFFLAQAEYGLGHQEAARAALDRASALRPGEALFSAFRDAMDQNLPWNPPLLPAKEPVREARQEKARGKAE